jgi:DNA polymerase III subunit epsilon
MVDQEGEPLESALRGFCEFIGDLPLVSFKADFDMGFLRNAANRQGIPIRNQVSCALKMERLAWPGRKSYRLRDLAEDGNLSNEDEHRAIGDCKRAVIVYMAAAMKLGFSEERLTKSAGL